MQWSDVAELFSWDGSWRDIYVRSADVQAWSRFLAAIPVWKLKYAYTENGAPAAFPPTQIPFVGASEGRALLEIRIGDATLNCHFSSESQIELDLDPREVCTAEALDAVLSFMSKLSEVVRRPAVLTPENCEAYALILVDAESGILRWQSSVPPSPRERIYVRLLDEGVNVWRPVEAERLTNDTLRLIAAQPKDDAIEQWEFAPGDAVRCRLIELSGGKVLVAVELWDETPTDT